MFVMFNKFATDSTMAFQGRRALHCHLLVALALGTFPIASATNMLAVEKIQFQTGAAFRQTMASPESVRWADNISLHEALQRISHSQKLAVMLDRRTDPDQPVEFVASKLPLEVMIQQLAEKQGASACHISSVVYVGPRETTDLLPTIAELRREEIRALPAVRQRELLRSTPWQWQRLSAPRELLTQLETEYGVRIVGKENMPHDLWPAVQLPELDFPAKLSLVLAGFHVTFKLSADGQAAQIVAMPKDASLTRRYTARANAATLAGQLSPQFPAAKISGDGRELIVDGRWEVHEAIARLLSGERIRPPVADNGKKNYTLTVENKPVGGVVQALAKHVDKKVVFDLKVERRLTNKVSISVKELSLDELLTAILAPAGLKHEIDGETIRVFD